LNILKTEIVDFRYDGPVLKFINMTRCSSLFLFWRGWFPLHADAFRGHGFSLLDEQARLAGSSAHAIPAGVAALHYNQPYDVHY